MEKYLLLVLAALVGTSGQILLKLGVNQSIPQIGEFHSFRGLLQVVFIFLKNYWIISAICLYGLGLMLWLFILLKFELSYAFPILAVIYVFVMFLSWLFFKEDISLLRIIGTLVIAIGVYLVAKS